MLSKKNKQFGKIRLWGAIGFGIAVLFSGVTVGVIMFIIHSFLLLLSLIVLIIMHNSIKIRPQKSTEVTVNGAFKLMKNGAFICLLALLFLTFAAIKSHDVFYSYGLDFLKASGWLIVFAWALGVLPEIWMFIWIDKLAKTKPNIWFLLAGALVYTIRLGILGWVNSAWVWSLSQILEGVAFCFLYVGAIKTINDLIPKTYQATGQSLFSFSYGIKKAL